MCREFVFWDELKELYGAKACGFCFHFVLFVMFIVGAADYSEEQVNCR